MLANNNLHICLTLVRRDFRFHRIKNLILVLAAALVTGLYTFVFLLGGAVEGAFLLNYQYTYGSTSHILFTGLTEHQADALAAHANVRSAVRLSTVGTLSDPMIGQRSVKLAVTDRDYAETVLSIPTTGRLPESAGEIALDEYTMNSLGILHEIGAPVSLQWTDASGAVHESEFTLCGWWASPTNFSEACAWIPSESAEVLAPDYNSENARSVTLGVTLHQPRDLALQAEEMLADQGISGVSYTTNLAYNDARREQAAGQAQRYYAPSALVLLCGFLMLYGIIHVASERDTAFFAGLKAQGMTPRQLRRFLAEKGCAVAVLGLLPGFLLGFLLNLVITGRVVIGMDENPALFFLSWRPFAAAAAGALLTVLLAYLLPALRLSRKTPAQALRGSVAGSGRGRRHGDGLLTLPRLALRTLVRGKGHAAFSIASMLLAVLLLTAEWLQYVSYQEDIYLAALSPWDYTIADGSAYLSVQRYNQDNRFITDETVETLRARPEVTAVSTVKTREVPLTASDTLHQRIVDYYNQPYDETMTLRESQAGYPDWVAGLDAFTETGTYTAVVVGLDGAYLDYVLENCPFTSGEFDAEAFESGDYVLAGGAYREGISSPAAGEILELAGETFTVLGSVMHDNTYLSGSNSLEAAFTLYYLLPLDTFNTLFPGQGIRSLAVDIDSSQQASFEDYLDEMEQGLYRGVAITRRSEYQEYFRNARLNEVMVEGIVAAVLTAIAILNFINLLVTKAVRRRQEFAVYQSLGMTAAQLRRLLLLEGIFYALLTALILVPVTLAFALLVMPGYIAESSWVSVYTFSVTPLWIALPVILALAVAVPLLCQRFVTRGTIQERLRTAE